MIAGFYDSTLNHMSFFLINHMSFLYCSGPKWTKWIEVIEMNQIDQNTTLMWLNINITIINTMLTFLHILWI